MAAVRARRQAPAKTRNAPPAPPPPRLAVAKLANKRRRDFDDEPKPVNHARAFFAGAVLFAGIATAGAALFGSQLYDFREAAASGADDALTRLGLGVDAIAVPNIDAARAAEVRAMVLPPARGSMFAADPDAVKARVESLDWVDSADVQRLWPSTIRVEITKRRAIARWQEDGQVTLIDEAGERVHASRGIDASRLPLVVGRGAGPAAEPVLRALEQMPEIRSRLRALVRVGERRWDARLAGGISVALPEREPEVALMALERLHAQGGILDRAVQRIDLRQPSIVTIAPAERAANFYSQGA